MERRSWPWKKKSSEKSATIPDSNSVPLSNSCAPSADQENSKTVKYVQISTETYAHLTELGDQVKGLTEKLSSAQSEMTTKDDLVKQHAKVAEEAVSGWEKAEAEALALKHQLEAVTLLKLTAEDRASHLDGALKECMKQIRNVKEESEQKLRDTVSAKNKQLEKVKLELEAKILDFEQEFLRVSAENDALSRSLQEHTNVLMKISDEKSQADAEIEVLKSNIQSCEREISSLKYEIQIVSKEVEIRNEEKDMTRRSAEVANKQHVEDVKKITKLEAECQRLRGLVRKKLPGPAALAQMKLEVESLGREYGDTRAQQSSARSSSPRFGSASDFAFQNMQHFQKENEFLTVRLLAMEEETKMLKEALSKRNSELQASRSMCARTASRLRSLETNMLVNQQQCSSKSNIDITFEGALTESSPPSLTSMSEDGIDDEGSCSESWATALISELSQFKKEKGVHKGQKAENLKHLDLMDDFLEMEKLACSSTEANGIVDTPDGASKKMNENGHAIVDTENDGDKEQQQHLEQASNLSSPEHHAESTLNGKSVPISRLLSRLAAMLESQTPETDMMKLLDDIGNVVRDMQEVLPQRSIGCIKGKPNSMDPEQKQHAEEIGEAKVTVFSLHQETNSTMDGEDAKDQEWEVAISNIEDFVISLGKEATEVQGRSTDDEIRAKIKEFSASSAKVVRKEIGVHDFVIALSCILSQTRELAFTMSRNKDNEGESNSSDCIDKLTLLDYKVALEPTKEKFSGVCTLVSHSGSDPEVEGPISPGFEVMSEVNQCTLKEYEQLKMEKEALEVNLGRCTESLEDTKLQLMEMEKRLAELKLELAASEKSNSLAETQLKCMAESYKSLESRTLELEAEINQLRAETETLGSELQEERRCHEEDLAKYKDLQDEIERKGRCSTSMEADSEMKTKQEREISAAAEKLAECQETIFLLSKQLNQLCPPAELMGSLPKDTHRMSDDLMEVDVSPGIFNQQLMLSPQHIDQAETEDAAASTAQRTGDESPSNGSNSQMIPADTKSSTFQRSPSGSKIQKQSSTKSSSSSSISSATNEKHGRGLSRFFSKAKSDR